MMITLTVFELSSLACAFARGPGEFIAARTVLGLSAGFMIPLVPSVVTVMFSDEERTRPERVLPSGSTRSGLSGSRGTTPPR